ncbi:C40 family peptidase [Candidatus Parcubacteria bacterium]|nr:C40 family peptidase [Candidatus Parcubacteria bacterium]
MAWIYRVGLSKNDVSEEMFAKSGFKYTLINPRKQIVASVKKVVGKPYKRGSSVLKDAPNTFDCSALVAWAAVESGYAIPRVTIDQFVFSKRINKEELQPGDLIFSNTKEIIHTVGTYFSQVLDKEVHEEPIRYETLEYMPGTKVPHGVDHVGVYLGDDKVIHATSTRGGVVEDILNESPQFQNIVGYGRIIDNEEDRYVVEIPEDRPDLRNKENLIKEINKHA